MCVIVIHGHHHRSYMICGDDKRLSSHGAASACHTALQKLMLPGIVVLFCSVQYKI